MFPPNVTAVLGHGCHVDAQLGSRSWRNLIWGSDDDMPTFAGRVPMTILVALRNNARMIIFSTGASEKDGLKEAEYTFRFLMERLEPLRALFEEQGYPLGSLSLEAFIKSRAVLDVVSQNTAEETRLNLRRAVEGGCNQVIGVTNAFHAPRCLAGLQSASVELSYSGVVSVVPANDDAEGTVILEPPHRGDRPKTKWHVLARQFFKVKDQQRAAFENELVLLFDKYGTY